MREDHFRSHLPKPLNIVLISTHDSGRHFGCYGHKTLSTPAIDAIAADGVLLKNLFTTSPICSPARCSTLTGLYPQQHGVMDLVGIRGWELKDRSLHLAARLQKAGFSTALIGTQHEVECGQEASLGFDQIEGRAIPGQERPSAGCAAEMARAYLSTRSEKTDPFYLQVGFFETHTPFDFRGAKPDSEKGVEVPPYLADDEGNRKQMVAFQGSVRQADQGVATIVAALKEFGLEENTLLVVTTDHGIEMPRAKWELFDPGLETAMILRCPALGIDSGRKVEALLSAVDFVPSILDLLDLPVASVAGRSFAENLRGDDDKQRHEAIFAMFHQAGNPRGVRTERYKLIRYFNDFGIYAQPVESDKLLQKSVPNSLLLYDLENDPWEFNDLSRDPSHATIREELDARLWRWMERVEDPLLHGPTETPTYRSVISEYQKWKAEEQPPDQA